MSTESSGSAGLDRSCEVLERGNSGYRGRVGRQQPCGLFPLSVDPVRQRGQSGLSLADVVTENPLGSLEEVGATAVGGVAEEEQVPACVGSAAVRMAGQGVDTECERAHRQGFSVVQRAVDPQAFLHAEEPSEGAAPEGTAGLDLALHKWHLGVEGHDRGVRKGRDAGHMVQVRVGQENGRDVTDRTPHGRQHPSDGRGIRFAAGVDEHDPPFATGIEQERTHVAAIGDPGRARASGAPFSVGRAPRHARARGPGERHGQQGCRHQAVTARCRHACWLGHGCKPTRRRAVVADAPVR